MLVDDPTVARRTLRLGVFALSVLATVVALALPAAAFAGSAAPATALGELDCNGQSPIQHAVRASAACTDIRGFNNQDNQYTWDGRFYDNGEYIGHDEPDMTFLSHQPGSGNNVSWTETLPRDPAAAPTATDPGSDVSHWFELSVAPWFSMQMCDSRSYPQTGCKPESDSNAPVGSGVNAHGGGGSAFMEMQFYPPGFAPFDDAISCDNTHWCGAMNIDSLECAPGPNGGFTNCNTACEEPVNFAYIQTDGVPTGPASPQEADLATFTPNANTLLMNPGDTIRVHMFDAPVPGGGGAMAFEVRVTDYTTGQSGYMQASAANGFQDTSIANCAGTPYNFQPAYNTAGRQEVTPWGADQTNISTEYETGHWEPCTSLTDPATLNLSSTITDTYYNTCIGPYEAKDDSGSPEVSDAFCYPAGDTHGALHTSPDTTTGCLDDYFQNGDLDFDGSPYWPEWPIGPSPTQGLPGSFVENMPVTNGSQYPQYFIQSDVALSESTCSGTTTQGCGVPPGVAPGHFYPYWTRVTTHHGCVLEFGNVSAGAGVNDLGRDKQYGADRIATLGYPQFEGPVMSNTCATGGANGT